MQAAALRSEFQPSVLVLASDARGGEEICDALEDAGWRVRCPETVAEALLVLVGGWPCDAIVAELDGEGGVGGAEVGKLARKLLGHLPVIHLASRIPDAALQAQVADEAIFITQPAPPEMVAWRLDEAMGRPSA
jgi:hypothetical protein